MTPQRWLDFLRIIADQGDAVALRYFRSPLLAVTEKPNAGPATQADLEIERLARQMIEAHHPGVGVCGEEFGEMQGASDSRLIIDPIDATNNFVRGIPVFATLLAVERDGEIIAGLVSAPALRRRWHATRGGGAFENGERMRVSETGRPEEATLFHSSLNNLSPEQRNGLLALSAITRRQRGFGDFYQHMLVAAGCGEMAVDPGLEPWDIAPLLLIVEEAGGRATSFTAERTIYGGSLVTSNGLLHETALQFLSGRDAASRQAATPAAR
ncbi:MAG: histidinol phosphatase [Betaproteobacteria bacterium]|nr:histidinol phosphatase [Betaproteobacteria bacterium]